MNYTTLMQQYRDKIHYLSQELDNMRQKNNEIGELIEGVDMLRAALEKISGCDECDPEISISLLQLIARESLADRPRDVIWKEKQLLFQMGWDAHRRHMDNWLDDTFEYENSQLIVHRVRLALQTTPAGFPEMRRYFAEGNLPEIRKTGKPGIVLVRYE